MTPIAFSSNVVRVGVLAITGSNSLLDDVGRSAWLRIGGASIEASLPASRFALLRMLVLPRGSREEIAQILSDWCDAPNADFRCQVVLTVGGDGFGAGDNLPEATRDVIDGEAPGIAERLRQACIEASSDPEAARSRVGLTRGIAGLRGGTLIVNLPSSFPDASCAISALLPLLPDVLRQLRV